MSRLAQHEIAQARPLRGVRVTARDDGLSHIVACGTCAHVEVIRGPKAAAEEQARWHRDQHRSAK